MKQFTVVLTIALFFIGANAFTQIKSTFIIIDQIAENIPELEKQFTKQKQVFYKTDGIEPNAIKQISTIIKTNKVDILKIFVPTKPGAIVFNSIAITPKNINEYTEELRTWNQYVSSQVIINSNVVFDGKDGALLKQRLENITGLNFSTYK